MRGITQLTIAPLSRVPIVLRSEVGNQPAGVVVPDTEVRPLEDGASLENTSTGTSDVGVRGIVQAGYRFPRLSYAIELELADGTRVPSFASRSEPFDVQVQRSKADADELADARPADAREVGLNYAAPWVRLRLHDSAFISAHLLTGVTEVDFSFGAGAALTLGDPYGAHLGLGVESIEGFGTRFFTRVNIVVSDRISLAPIIEATDMPNAGHYGVRLLADLSAQVTPELRLGVLGGYQARNAVSGGLSLGANASYAF